MNDPSELVMLLTIKFCFYLPGGGVGSGPGWGLPADELQTEQLIFFSLLHHPAGSPYHRQRCVSGGLRMPRHLVEFQRFHLSAGTGKIVLCWQLDGHRCSSIHNEVFSSLVCLYASRGLLCGEYSCSIGLFSLYKGMQVTHKVM